MKTYSVEVADLSDIMDQFIFDEEHEEVLEHITNSEYSFGSNDMSLVAMRNFCDLVREALTEERGEEFTEEVTQALSYKTLINLEA